MGWTRAVTRGCVAAATENGGVSASRKPATAPFTREEVARARRYHRPRYVWTVADLVIGLGLLAALSFSSLGDVVYGPFDGWPWWAAASGFAALIVVLSWLVRLPVSFWRGYRHERAWGFSTQGVGGWLADRARGLAVAVILTPAVLLGFVAVARTWPEAWPAVAGPALAGVVLFLSFLAPVVLEPIFNRFAPLPDPELAADVRALADRAEVPVRDVLVADASRRTRKENAYVSGLGATRRVVLYDTLLARGKRGEVEVVVAHELGHRRLRHVALATAAAMGGAVVAVLVLWGVLEAEPVRRAVGATGAGDPRVLPLVLLVVAALELVSAPVASALSRRLESAADRFALELTGDPVAFEASFVSLARSNLSDLDPPRLAYAMFFTHPTPPERIAAARRWGERRARPRPA